MLRRARGCLPASGETRSMHSLGVIVAGVLSSLLSVVGFTCSQITYPYGYLPYVWYFTILGQLPQKNAPGPQTWLSVGELPRRLRFGIRVRRRTDGSECALLTLSLLINNPRAHSINMLHQH